MQIVHYDPYTRIRCPGALFPNGVVVGGTVYRCSLCGKEFVVDPYGNVLL